MKSTYLSARLLAVAWSISFLGFPAVAQTNDGAVKTDIGSTDPQSVLKYSKEGHLALRDVEAARLAIFTGHLKTAADLIVQAKADINKASKGISAAIQPEGTDSDSSIKAPSESAPQDLAMIPVDGQLSVADDFVATPEKQAHIDKANENIKKGNHEQALEELHLGQIAIVYSRLWMPVVPAEKHLDQAADLMNQQKYYEANLALKAVGDSLTAESIALTGDPRNGDAAKATK